MESSGLRSVAVTVMKGLLRRSTSVSTRRAIVLVGAVAVLLVGCRSSSSSRQASAPSTTPSPAAVAPTPQDPSGLYGKDFKATSATENGNPRALLSNYPIDISFGSHGRGVFFSASCNGEGAKNGNLTAEKVIVAPHSVFSTAAACEPKSSEQGQWFDAFLATNPDWQLAGRSLTLTNGTATVRFVRFTPMRQ
jgi:heat shock protein HslJ